MIITELSPTVNGTGIPSETGSVSESLLTATFQTQERCLNAGHPYKVTSPQAGNLQIFADQAAAITGGLTAGQVYFTSVGQLMVVRY